MFARRFYSWNWYICCVIKWFENYNEKLHLNGTFRIEKESKHSFLGSMSTMPHTFLLFTRKPNQEHEIFQFSTCIEALPIGTIFTVRRLHFDERVFYCRNNKMNQLKIENHSKFKQSIRSFYTRWNVLGMLKWANVSVVINDQNDFSSKNTLSFTFQ